MVEISQCISKRNPKIYMHWMAVHVLLRLHVCFLTLDMRMYSTRNPDICIVFWWEYFEALPAAITNS